MATLTASPARPTAGTPVKITFSGLNASTNMLRVFAVAAPEDSAVRKQLDRATRDRPQVHTGPAAVPWDFTPDKGGVFRFFVEEYQIRPASGGMFQGDPAGAPAPEILATSNVALEVGQRMQLQLGVSPSTALLTIYVWGDTIHPTTIGVHGEETPAVTDPSNQIAANASEDADVLAAVAALSGVTAATALGDIGAVFSSLRSVYAAHIANATHHNAADAWNTIGSGYTAASAAARIRSINELRRVLRGHQDNLVDPDPLGSPTKPHDAVDGTNFYLTAGASSDAASQMVGLVDTWMVYEAHRAIGAPVHNSADTTSVAPTLSPLMTVHRRFLAALASQTPTTPPDTNEAVSLLAQLGGFVEAP